MHFLKQVLGSVAEAAGLVAPRNILVVYTLPGVEVAVPATAVAITAPAEGLEGAGSGTGGGRGRTSGGAGGGVGGGAGGVVAQSRDQVPLFRYKSIFHWIFSAKKTD